MPSAIGHRVIEAPIGARSSSKSPKLWVDVELCQVWNLIWRSRYNYLRIEHRGWACREIGAILSACLQVNMRIEIQVGDYFGEVDIEGREDDYGRGS